MYHAAGAKLKPAGILAGGAALAAADKALDIKLEAGLNEREEAGAQAHRDILLENLGEHRLHEIDKVRNGYVLVDHHAFHLEESILVAGVDLLVSEAASGKDGAKRNTFFKVGGVFAKNSVLRRRGVGLEQLAVAQVICVLHVARGMVLRNVERLEAVVVVCDLGVVLNGEAHVKEYLVNLALNERYRAVRAGVRVAGERLVVDLGAFNEALFFKSLELLETLLHGGLDELFYRVYLLTCLFLLIVGQGAKLAHEICDVTLFAEELYPQLLKLRDLARLGGFLFE